MRILVYVILAATHALADDPRTPIRFERVVIDADFPGGYQVEVADVNGDKKPDVVALGGSTLAWYENPSWTKRVVSTSKQTPDIISSATADLDGDGKAEIAIAYDFSMNEPGRGKLLLAVQTGEAARPWRFEECPSAFGSIHRLRWGRFDARGRGPDLLIAPLFGSEARPPGFQEPGNLSIFYHRLLRPDGGATRFPTPNTHDFVKSRPVLHAVEVVDVDGDGFSEILTADNLGVQLWRPAPANLPQHWPSTPLIPGAPGEAPKRGCSEVHLGKLAGGRRFLATLDPWHGTEVAISVEAPPGSLKFAPRLVIDSTLKEGHALWVADVDGDGEDEVFAGYRGGAGGVLMYDLDGSTWTRSVLDPGVTAQDLRGGDLDGDGTPDVVAIGGKSHNVVWYRPIRAAK